MDLCDHTSKLRLGDLDGSHDTANLVADSGLPFHKLIYDVVVVAVLVPVIGPYAAVFVGMLVVIALDVVGGLY